MVYNIIAIDWGKMLFTQKRNDVQEVVRMKVSELFKYAIERGIQHDPRGEKGVKRYLDDTQEEFNKLDESSRWEFDEDRLWNPYDDSRLLNNPGDPEVKKVLMGINIDTAEVLVADRLNEKKEGFDLVIGHHPRGVAMPGLHKVMNIQKDFYADWGVPINVAEQLMEPRIQEVMRAFMPMNHNQAVDSARLLGVNVMCTHSPSDIMAQDFMQKHIDSAELFTVAEVISHIKTIPEYRKATLLKNGPRVVVGKEKNRVGKVAVKFAGGTGGAKTLYEAFETAGVGTMVCMHIKEDHVELAEKHHINVVVAGHMPSDSLGMNLLYKELEGKDLEIVRFSGLIPPGDE